MENHPSRSRSHHRRHHSSAVFYKKVDEAHSFGGRAAYDDLRSGRRQFGAHTASSRVDDYNEIFNSSKASRGSSIPILDLPPVEETEVSGSCGFRSSEIDYSKIFGGLGDADFASTYEELFTGPKGGETSSDETWTPAETGSPSEDSDSFNSYEAPHQPLNGKKQFNMSYHKTNQQSRDGTNGTTHIAQLHAVPGFTRVIDEETLLRKAKENKPIPPIISDATLNRNINERTISGKHRRATSDFQNLRMSRSTSEGDVKCQSGYCGNTTVLSGDETNLKNHPTKGTPLSNMSLNLDNRKRGPYRSMSANLEGFEGARSSQFSDEEVDVNSAAAASAIALRKAIEEAQARIKIAKESLGKKARGLDNSFKSSFKDSFKAKTKSEGSVAAKAQVLNEKPHKNCEKNDIAEQVFDVKERPNARNTGFLAPNFIEDVNLLHSKTPEGSNDKDYISILATRKLGRECEQKVVEQFHEFTMTGKQIAATLVSMQAESKKKWVQCIDEHEQKEKETVVKAFQQPVGDSGNLTTAAEAHELEITVQKHSAVPRTKQLEEHVKCLDLDHGANEQIENKKKLKVFPEQEDLEKLENSPEPDYVPGLGDQQGVDNKDESRLKEAQKQVDNEKPLGVAHEHDHNETVVEEVAEYEEHDDENIREMHGHDKMEKTPNENCECGEVIKERVFEARGQEENKELNCSYEEEYNERGFQEVLKQDVDEEQPSDAPDSEESDNRLEEDCKWEENLKLRDHQKYEDNENVLESDYLMEKDNERPQEVAQELEEIHAMGTGTCQSEVNGQVIKSNQEATILEEDILQVDNGACGWNEFENLGQTQESCEDGEEVKEFEVHDGIGRIADGAKASCGLEHSEEFKAVNLEAVLDEREEFEGADRGLDDVKYDEAPPSDSIDLKEDNMNLEGKEIDENATSASEQKQGVEKLAHELGGDVNHATESKVSDHKTDGNDLRSVDEDGIEIGKDKSTTLLPCMFDGNKEIMKKDEEIERNRTTEKGEKNINETIAREELETKKVLQKDVEVDREDLRKMNTEKAKEREREKDRLAVERAIREARERAFAEARERAERAAVERAGAEALQREKAKAQGRFEKASAEAKLLAEKASEQAKLKAQRAAVERATAEARGRALQRALSEKSSFVGKEDTNRFSTEKFSGVSRDNAAKQRFPSSDVQVQGSGPSNGSKYSNSTGHEAANATERFDGARGESAQRCRAKLERHQRTVERAAKALAEKNMRDLLVLKEQAERNRLAAGLDAEVKRWSSGKLGNLRALLSTLQYILGSDSGWQSIPLTDMVTSSAVKKAYRKAALCVHPDKLQQRGANIQQKYICEKVFDLLKDAWNKFNSEER